MFSNSHSTFLSTLELLRSDLVKSPFWLMYILLQISPENLVLHPSDTL